MYFSNLIYFFTTLILFFLVSCTSNSSKNNDPTVKNDSALTVYGRKAQRDIAAGKIIRITMGSKPPFGFKRYDSLATKYGFHDSLINYEITPAQEKEVKDYNAVIEEYLVQINGEDWKDRFKGDLHRMSQYDDSIMEIKYRNRIINAYMIYDLPKR